MHLDPEMEFSAPDAHCLVPTLTHTWEPLASPVSESSFHSLAGPFLLRLLCGSLRVAVPCRARMVVQEDCSRPAGLGACLLEPVKAQYL